MSRRSILGSAGLVVSLIASSVALATEARPFDAGSMAAIRAEQAGHPFALVFWSASCVPCVKELPAWGRRLREHAKVPVLLVNLDPVAEQPAAIALARRKVGRGVQQWSLADTVQERVYWSVNPAWHGETPYTLLHDASHRAEMYYGLISENYLSHWYSGK